MTARTLRRFEEISQLHESVPHLARREYGLGGSRFDLKVDGILSRIMLVSRNNEFNDRLPLLPIFGSLERRDWGVGRERSLMC